MASNIVRGLYFPYANINSAKTLKTATLYFDKIGVIDPRASFCGESGSSRHLDDESRRYLNEIDTLIKEGIIEIVDPAQVVSEFGEEIMTGVIQDLQSEDFLRLCRPFVASSWVLSSAKLPGDADRWLRNLLVNVPTLARSIVPFQGGDIARERLREEFQRQGWRLIERHPELYERMLRFAEEDPSFGRWMFAEFRFQLRERDPYFEERFRERRFVERSRFEERRRFEERGRSRYDDEYDASLLRGVMFEDYRMVELPFAIGESIMIGHALATAAIGEFTPFCDERVHFDALGVRLRNLSTSKALKAVLYEYGYVRDAKTDLTALQVIDETVPSLEAVPLEKILKFREKRTEEIERFRVEMRRLIAEIESTPWDNNFSRYVSDVVESKVKPALGELRDQIQECRDSFWVDVVKTIASVGPLPIVGSIFAGVPPHVAVGLGATFAALTLILERWTKTRKVKRNGWALLLDAGKLARARPKQA